MTLRLLTILGLSLSLVMFTGCDDDDTENEIAAGEAAAGEAAAGEAAAGEAAAGEAAAGEAAAGEAAAGEAAAGEAAAGEAAAGEAAAGEAAAGEEATEKNIVETAIDNGSFTTLVAAVEAAGLVDVLTGEGPFTVLAPNDEAFAALPEGTVEALVEDAQNGGTQLAEILTMHVVVGAAVMSGDLTDGQIVTTENGDLTVAISAEGTVTFSNGNVTATVIAADVEASNGVIHVIDSVIVPAAEEPAEKNIVETAVDNGSFETLVAAVTAADLAETLSGEGPFTVLAPNDEAFAALPAGTVDSLLEDAQNGGTQLADILMLHVVVGAAVMSGDLTDGQVVATGNGDLTVAISGEGVVTFSNGNTTATVIGADVSASNGVIHVIDSVLLPATEE